MFGIHISGWQDRVFHDGAAQHQAVLLAIFRYHGDAVFHGIAGTVDLNLSAFHRDSSALRPVQAKHTAQRFGPPRADDPGKAQNLALMNLKGDVFYFLPAF